MPHRPRKAAGRCKCPLMRFAADKKERKAPIYRLEGRLTGRKRRIPCGIFRFRSRDTAFFNCPRRSPPTQAASRTGGVPPTGAPGGGMGRWAVPTAAGRGCTGRRRDTHGARPGTARQGGGVPAREAGPWEATAGTGKARQPAMPGQRRAGSRAHRPPGDTARAEATLPDHVQHARRKRRERDGARGHPCWGRGVREAVRLWWRWPYRRRTRRGHGAGAR